MNIATISASRSASNGSASGSSTSVESESSNVAVSQETSSIYNILPSYQMHQAIVAKSVALSPNYLEPVPAYTFEHEEPESSQSNKIDPLEISAVGPPPHVHERYNSRTGSVESNSNSNSNSSCQSSLFSAARSTSTRSFDSTSISIPPPNTASRGSISGPETFVLQPYESSQYLEQGGEKILNTHHNLKNADVKAIEMSIHLTSAKGKPGAIPSLIPLDHQKQYTTGDYIHGFVLMENVSETPIPFSMFYVLLEGNITTYKDMLSKNRKPAKVTTFLQSVDITACYNYSGIDQSVELDRVDNTRIAFPDSMLMCPGVKYKRFFSFRIPEKLLESNNKPDGLARQLELPSSIPLNDNHSQSLFFFNISVDYSVQAKFIGKQPNEYIILKESIHNINIVPKTMPLPPDEIQAYREEVKFLERHLRTRAIDSIEYGKKIRKLIPNELHQKEEYNSLSYTEPPQNSPLHANGPLNIHCSSIPITRKSFGRASKSSGVLSISVSTEHHEVKYVPQSEFRTESVSDSTLNTWKIHVPVKLLFRENLPNNVNNTKLPEITHVTATLESFSYVADTHPIPIQFDHDMLFDNEAGEDFHSFVKQYEVLEKDLVDQVHGIPDRSEYHVDPNLVEDLRAITRCKSKKTTLDVHGITMFGTTKLNSKQFPWKVNEGSPSFSKDIEVSLDLSKGSEFSKEINVSLDLSESHSRKSLTKTGESLSFDKHCLVPSFQNCYVGRMYYVQLSIFVSNSHKTTTKIPISIVK